MATCSQWGMKVHNSGLYFQEDNKSLIQHTKQMLQESALKIRATEDPVLPQWQNLHRT